MKKYKVLTVLLILVLTMVPVRADNIQVFEDAQAALDEYNQAQTQERWKALKKELKELQEWWKAERERVAREGFAPVVVPVTQPPNGGAAITPETETIDTTVTNPPKGNAVGFGIPEEDKPFDITELLGGRTTGDATAPTTPPQPDEDGRPPLLFDNSD